METTSAKGKKKGKEKTRKREKVEGGPMVPMANQAATTSVGPGGKPTKGPRKAAGKPTAGTPAKPKAGARANKKNAVTAGPGGAGKRRPGLIAKVQWCL